MTNEPQDTLKDEFQAFGQNLKQALNTAWDSEERAKAQSDIENGINELGQALNNFVTSFSASETGQKIIHEVDEMGEKLRSGEARQAAEDGLLSVLRKLNGELEKASEKFTPRPEQKEQ